MLESQKAPERTTLTLAELTEMQHEVRADHAARPRLSQHRRHPSRAEQKKYPGLGSPLSPIVIACCKPTLIWKAKKKFTKNIFSSWSMCSGAIRRNTSQCAARFASCCSVTRRKSPSCFTSRARFATRRSNPARTSDERARALIELHTKLRNILTKVDQIMEKAKRLGRPLERVNTVRDEIEQLQKDMLEQF